MQKYCPVLCLAVAAACLLIGCTRNVPAAEPSPAPSPAEAATLETSGPATGEDAAPTGVQSGTVLYMDFTAGSETESVRPVESAAIPADSLSDTLTDTTGIRFDFTLAWQGSSCTVTWQKDSALWCTEMPQDADPDYVFYDSDLLRWFLLDTVWRTLQQSYGAGDIFYQNAEGQTLTLDDLWPLEHFDLAQPYRGSSWYYGESIAYLEQWDLLEQSGQP